MNILVLDVGTSNIRGILYDENAKNLFSHRITYKVDFKDSIYAEQDASDWANAIVEIGRATVDFCREKGCSVDAISLTSQRSSVIPVDKKGLALMPTIMWQDKRNSDIIKEFRGMERAIHRCTGARINTVFSGTKMTWIRRNEPEIYKKTYKFCTIADFIIHEMTGEYLTDHTYGSRSLLMNIRTRRWDPKLMDIFDVEENKLCELREPGTVIGLISDEFSQKTGIKAGTPFVSAGGDQQCSALGHGVTSPGSLEITTGTGAFMLGFSEKVPENLNEDIICGVHAMPGKYVLESSMLTCAALYNWAKVNLFNESDTDDEPYERINEAVMMSPPGANGCIVLPYFQGRGTPDWNADVKGYFAGIGLNTTRADMARAILEAIALEAKNNLDIVEQYVGTVDKLLIGGGLTKFKEFNQIEADVYQKTLTYSNHSVEQTALGAWTNAAVALDVYKDHETAIAKAKENNLIETYVPNPAFKAVYEKKLQAMNNLYEAVKKF